MTDTKELREKVAAANKLLTDSLDRHFGLWSSPSFNEPRSAAWNAHKLLKEALALPSEGGATRPVGEGALARVPAHQMTAAVGSWAALATPTPARAEGEDETVARIIMQRFSGYQTPGAPLPTSGGLTWGDARSVAAQIVAALRRPVGQVERNHPEIPEGSPSRPAPGQDGVREAAAIGWVRDAFGGYDQPIDRALRLLEEALELAQADGATEAEAQALVRQVFGRPVDPSPEAEFRGVMFCAGAYAASRGLTMDAAFDAELARVNTPEVLARARRKVANREIVMRAALSQPTDTGEAGR